MTSGPAEACTVTMSGRSRATARAAPATVAGMSCSLRSRKTRTPLAPLIEATTPGPYRRYSSSPIFTVLTCGVTRPAQRAAVSRSGASSATAIGAGWLNSPPRVRVRQDACGAPLVGGPGQPAHRRTPRLVREPDHVGQPLDATPPEFLVELAQDADAGRRVVEDRRADAHHGRPGQDELQRVP